MVEINGLEPSTPTLDSPSVGMSTYCYMVWGLCEKLSFASRVTPDNLPNGKHTNEICVGVGQGGTKKQECETPVKWWWK